MEGYKTLQEYAEEVRKNKNNPHILADLHIDIAAKYSSLAEIYKDIQLEKAEFWQIKFAGEKSLSDAYIEAKWRLTEGGMKEMRLKLEMKSLEKLMGAIKTASVVTAVENRQY